MRTIVKRLVLVVSLAGILLTLVGNKGFGPKTYGDQIDPGPQYKVTK